MRAINVATVVSAANGTLPVTDSISTSASEYTSVLPSTGLPCACSGDAYRAVPNTTPDGSVQAASAIAACEPEVGDAQPTLLVEQQVRRLDVSVDDASAMRVLEPSRRLEADHERLRRRQEPPGIEHRPQAAAAEVLEHEVRAVLGEVGLLAPVVDRHDVGMTQGGRGAGPRLESA